MITNALLVITQVAILFILIAVGYLTRKIKMVDENGLRQMSGILLVIVTPAVIINAFQAAFDMKMLQGLLIAAGSAVATHAAGALISWLLFRKTPGDQAKVLRCAIMFSNCSYFCLPLLNAILGLRGILFGSVYVAVYYMILWTYGIWLMTGRKSEISAKRILLNPGTLSILVALPISLLKINLPDVVKTILTQIAALNTPLAMLVVGGQMAAVPLALLFKNRRIYLVTFFRLLVIPAAMMLILHLLPVNRELLLSCLLPAAAPTAAGVALFAIRYDREPGTATQAIAFSTLFSILTIPLMILLSDAIGYVLK